MATKKASKAKSSVIKHLKEDNKDCKKETKEHNKLIKKIKKTK